MVLQVESLVVRYGPIVAVRESLASRRAGRDRRPARRERRRQVELPERRRRAGPGRLRAGRVPGGGAAAPPRRSRSSIEGSRSRRRDAASSRGSPLRTTSASGASRSATGPRQTAARERVLDLFPILRERSHQLGRHAVRRPAADACDRPVADGRPAAPPPRRAVARPGADPRRPDLRAASARLREEGTTILLVEQNVHRALEVADRAYVLVERRGRPGGAAPPSCARPPRSSGPTSGSGSRRGDRSMRLGGQEAIQQLINALSLGSTYALLALGLAMVFSILGLVNFAHGELVTVAAYTMYLENERGMPFAVQVPAAIVAAAARSGADGAGRVSPAARRELPHAAVLQLRDQRDHPELLPRRSLTEAAGRPAPRPVQRGDPHRQLHDRLAAGDHDDHVPRSARRADPVPAALDAGSRDARGRRRTSR